MNDKKMQKECLGPEKTGAFIKLLRVSHNLTQEELGDLIYVTRKAVSKWENGICYPSIDLIPRIADLFGVSLEEILSGEFNVAYDENLNTLDYVIKVLKSKRIKAIIKSTIAFLTLCLLIFFFENYNATKIYDVYYEDDNIYISNSILISTRSKLYFNFGMITTDTNEILNNTTVKFRLHITKNNKDVTLATYSMNNIPYYRNADYKELSNLDLNNHINDLRLNIQYIDSNNVEINKDVKLIVKLKYKSNDINQFKNYSTLYVPADLTHNSIKIHDLGNQRNIKNKVDISYILNLSEREREKRFNITVGNLEVSYINQYMTISDSEYELTINFNTLDYFIMEKGNIGKQKTIRRINENTIRFDYMLNNKTSDFINKVLNFLSNYNR